MERRRELLAALAASAAIACVAVPAGALAAQPTIEIVALPHWPVQNALKPVRDFLGTLGTRVKVIEFDAESPAGEKKLSAAGLKGHVPILLLINGSDSFKRADGTAVEFKDFPAKADNPLRLNGSWTVGDFESAVNAALGAKK